MAIIVCDLAILALAWSKISNPKVVFSMINIIIIEIHKGAVPCGTSLSQSLRILSISVIRGIEKYSIKIIPILGESKDICRTFAWSDFPSLLMMAGDKALDSELVKELDWEATLLATPKAAFPFVEKNRLVKMLIPCVLIK